MATTSIGPKEPAAWLEISLSCQQLGPDVELTITVTNAHDTKQELAFSNQARKAELLGLLVFNEANERVMPTHNMLVKPLNASLEKHALAPGATFRYQLTGTLTQQGLVFPGAIFALNPAESYQARFRYAGKQSNAIRLLMANHPHAS